jgi:hypothetical protein
MMTKMTTQPEYLVVAHEKRMMTTEPKAAHVKFVLEKEVQVETSVRKVLHLVMPSHYQGSS